MANKIAGDCFLTGSSIQISNKKTWAINRIEFDMF